MATLSPITDQTGTVNPVSAGKLKQLWDAIRTVPVQSAPALSGGGPPPMAASPVQAPPQLAPAAQNIGPVVASTPTGPAPLSTAPPPPPVFPAPDRMAAPPPAAIADTDTLPPNNTMMKGPDVSTFPGTARVNQLQTGLDQLNAPPRTLMQRLAPFIPVAGAVTAAAIGRGQAGGAIRGVAQAQQNILAERNAERQNLTAQLQAAQVEREREYDTAQRTVERANAAAEMNRTRDVIARIMTGGRESVATTQAGARVGAAQIGAGARTTAATTQAGGRVDAAKLAADARVTAAKYAADAAMTRLQYSQGNTNARQQRSFEHTDTKPTADEDRRADLSKSLTDITNEMIGIAQRRPELFGPLSGRYTSLRAMVGTSDPDVSALEADREALGQVMLGAHSMRSAEHIAAAANSVVNAYHNDAGAFVSAAQAAQKNANTMSTVVRPALVGRVPQLGNTNTTAGATPRKLSGRTAAAPATGKKGDPLGLFN